jgi:TPR repeat protein
MKYAAKSLLLIVLGVAAMRTAAADCTATEVAPISLNRTAIMYARGRGVAKNTPLASTLFRRMALDGYTPAMVNLGTMYEQGMTGRRDHRRAYAWIRAALALGVPKEDYEATLFKLGIIAGRMGTARLGGAEALAVSIADEIAGRCGRPQERPADTTAMASEP